MPKSSAIKQTALRPQRTTEILKSPEQVSPYVDMVRSLADRHRTELGFLPASVYAEQAAHSHLWLSVEVDSQRLAGFLLYGGAFPHLKIFQLFITKHARNMGVGKSLIQELRKFGEENNFLTATAKVAAELPANSFWERNGFRIVSQIRGGSRGKGRLINVRLCELDSPSLFRITAQQDNRSTGTHQLHFSHGPTLSNRTYVVDLNVFFDVIRRRLNRESGQRVIAAALANEIRVLVTPEFSRELERHTMTGGSDPVLEFSQTLPTLPRVDPAVLDRLTARLGKIIFPNLHNAGKQVPNDISDLLHLAYCIHHRARGFLTSEKAILRRSDDLRKSFGIEILAPSDLIDSITGYGDPPERRKVTVDLQSGHVSLGLLEEHDRAAAEEYLKTTGMTSTEVASILDPGTSVARRVRVIAKSNDTVIGIASWSRTISELPELTGHVYADERSPAFDRVLDHFLERIQREGPHGDLKRIAVWSGSQSLKTRETLSARGFRPTGDIANEASRECYIKASLQGPLTKVNWDKVSASFFSITSCRLSPDLPSFAEVLNTGVVLKPRNSAFPLVVPLFDFETLISPGFLLTVGREGILVPIRETYAKSLIGLHTPQLDLLPSHEALLRLEKAYFLAPGRDQLFVRGTLIIFYVSGAGGGRKQAIGIARTTFADTLTVEQAQVSLARQGVLPEEDLRERAGKSGKLTAFAFDNFLVFPTPVLYSTLKELNCIGPANLVTAEKLPFQKIEKIISKAFSKPAR